eukprot:358897-Chlamydomonas_euryale.AAC.10
MKHWHSQVVRCSQLLARPVQTQIFVHELRLVLSHSTTWKVHQLPLCHNRWLAGATVVSRRKGCRFQVLVQVAHQGFVLVDAATWLVAVRIEVARRQRMPAHAVCLGAVCHDLAVNILIPHPWAVSHLCAMEQAGRQPVAGSKQKDGRCLRNMFTQRDLGAKNRLPREYRWRYHVLVPFEGAKARPNSRAPLATCQTANCTRSARPKARSGST